MLLRNIAELLRTVRAHGSGTEASGVGPEPDERHAAHESPFLQTSPFNRQRFVLTVQGNFWYKFFSPSQFKALAITANQGVCHALRQKGAPRCFARKLHPTEVAVVGFANVASDGRVHHTSWCPSPLS